MLRTFFNIYQFNFGNMGLLSRLWVNSPITPSVIRRVDQHLPFAELVIRWVDPISFTWSLIKVTIRTGILESPFVCQQTFVIHTKANFQANNSRQRLSFQVLSCHTKARYPEPISLLIIAHSFRSTYRGPIWHSSCIFSPTYYIIELTMILSLNWINHTALSVCEAGILI